VRNFIYDVGLHGGEDTAHYLSEGSKVVAIDANPKLCAAAEARFRDYIGAGQLKIINSGVADQKGQSTFWICDDVSEWSSFDRELASRHGSKHHAVTVNCVPIADIIDEFGVADYMKIDIEGNDRVCIAGLTIATAPRYISIEMNPPDAHPALRRLSELGYRGFKVICQNYSWAQVTDGNIWLYQLRAGHRIVRRLRKLRAAYFERVAGRRDGESGPWGEKTSGSWHSVDNALSLWAKLRDIGERAGNRGPNWWFDIRASK
jgi:FkbM family methyltransferase